MDEESMILTQFMSTHGFAPQLCLTWKSSISSLLLQNLSLLVLKLKEGIIVNPPPFGFPSLKTLLLQRVRYANRDTFSKLLSCCPVLQNLYVQSYLGDYDNLHSKHYIYIYLFIVTTNLR